MESIFIPNLIFQDGFWGCHVKLISLIHFAIFINLLRYVYFNFHVKPSLFLNKVFQKSPISQPNKTRHVWNISKITKNKTLLKMSTIK